MGAEFTELVGAIYGMPFKANSKIKVVTRRLAGIVNILLDDVTDEEVIPSIKKLKVQSALKKTKRSGIKKTNPC